MEIVFWISTAAIVLLATVYALIAACMLAAKYRMSHLPVRQAAPVPLGITDLRYR